MLLRFTKAARVSIEIARSQACRFHHDQVEPSHIFLGLLSNPSCDASIMSNNLQIAIEEVRMCIERRICLGPYVGSNHSAPPMSENADQILAAAIRVAYPSVYAGTKHLLFILLSEAKGTVADVVEENGLKTKAVLDSVRASFDNEQPLTRTVPPSLMKFLERLSGSGRRAISFAHLAAEQSGQAKIRPQDVLSGILALESGNANQVLNELGFKPSNEPVQEPKVLITQPVHLPGVDLLPSEPAMQVLEFALAKCEEEQKLFISTTHLLMGVLASSDLQLKEILASARNLQQRVKEAFERLERQDSAPPIQAPAAQDPWPNFSALARRVMSLSQQAALDYTHNFIDTEHLLIALLHQSNCDAVRVLEKLDVNLEDLNSAARRGMRAAPWFQPIRSLPFSGLAKKVFAFAEQERESFEHPQLGTAHLLLGMMRVTLSGAADLIARAGPTLERVREEILRLRELEWDARTQSDL